VEDLRQTSEAYLRARDTDKEALIGTLYRLVELYPAHLWKEDYLLFPMTNTILSDGDQEALLQGFKQQESPIGLDVHHGFEQLAEKIVAKAHVEEDASSALSAA